jgi:hypothetical protein
VGASSEDIQTSAVRPYLDGFTTSGYRVPALLKSIVTSPQFFTAPPPADGPAKLSMNAPAR